MRRGLSPTRSKVAEEMAVRRQQDLTSRREQDSSSRRQQDISSSRRPTNPSINHWKYFCHYNNAVYQGGMSAYKKHGRGLLLHDDGAAVITEYLHDTPTGHNIIFRDNSIASVLFKNANDYEIAYKAGRAILKVPFTEGNDSVHGVGMLIDYETCKIYELHFRRGALVDKILHLNRRNNEDVFKRNSIARLIGLKHEQAFALTFERPETMHVKRDGNELIIGYFDEDGEVHGLAFRLYGENVQVGGQRGLYLKPIERGYYRRSRLQTFGQKLFSNGNKYVGQFEGGQFHGHGMLVCPQEMKWVYGRFANGKLTQVIDSNNKKFTENEFQMWTQGLLDIHKRYRERWIDFTIQLPDELYLYSVLKETLRQPVTEVDPDIEEAAKEDEFRMGRIQQQFQEALPGNIDRSYVDVQLDKHYTLRSNKNSRLIDTPGRSRRSDSPSPPKYKPNIYIDDPKTTSRVEDTPIRKITHPIVTPKNPTPKNEEPREGQRHYRMQDPFQIELIKVPMEQTRREPTSSQRRKPISQEEPRPDPTPAVKIPYKVTREPNREPKQLKESSRQPIRQPPREPITTSLRYSQDLPRYDEGIYRRTYLNELERQREIYRRLQREDEDYIDYLRHGISRSPVHRDYYNTPPRYDTASKRYNGKIINKKTFNYQDPSPQRLPQRSPQRYPQRLPQRFPQRVAARDSSSRTGNSPYRSSPRNPDSLSNSRSFIENNYKHWR